MIKSYIKDNKWLIIILVIGTFLRLFHINYQSPWLDEIHTLNESNPNISIGELYDSILACEQMPPLYFFINYFLFKLFGHTILVARLFTSFVGIATFFSLYKSGKELVNKKVGLLSAFLY